MKNYYEPLLSVIVTVYNTEKYLNRCLESILNCTYRNIELIIVDDKSPGNVDEIVNSYQKTDNRIKYVKHDINKGLYHARITGVEKSTGEYIAFLDSDDHVSCDFYRQLIQKAENTSSDMVIGEYILEYEDGTFKYQNLAHTRILDIDLKGKKAKDLLFNQHGLDFSLHVVWNKIYSRTLWEKCYPYFVKQTKHLIMCEDVLYSSLFYYFAEHITNIHSGYVYYVQNNNSSISIGKNIDKIKKNINDVKLVFDFLIKLFECEFEEKEYKHQLLKWYDLLKKIWKNNIENADISYWHKKKLNSFFSVNQNSELTMEDNYFYSIHTERKLLKEEEIKLKILNSGIKIVSFDIFDTLIVRPFFEPTDLFILLENKVNKIMGITDKIRFKELRIEAEKIARDENKLKNPMFEDITLDDIYETIQALTGFNKECIEKIKQEEIKLELNYCCSRKFTKELFDLAIYLGKKVIITSDMYLPKDIIIKILEKNGYIGYDKLYLSSEVKLSKYSGNLYNYIQKQYNFKAEEYLHIGDNYQSDIIKAKKNGWNAYHLPKAIDVLSNRLQGYYGGEIYDKVFQKPFAFRNANGMLEYFGNRVMLAVIANEVFDNPYVDFNRDSDFNADPRIIGYFCLGPHLYAIADWLITEVEKHKYGNLNFMARDGYLPMKAFKMLNMYRHIDVKTNYLMLTRQSILPLQINSANDLFSLNYNINIFANSPKSIIKMFNYWIKSETINNIESILAKEGIIFDKNFDNLESYYKFIKLFKDKIYDKEKMKEYKTVLGNCLEEYYDGKTADFDIGYSCRIESVLKKNFGFDVTSYFIHINNNIAIERAQSSNVEIKTFFNYSPGVTGTLRELLISKMAPSCKMLDIKNGKLIPVFKEYNNDYYENFVIGIIQRYALKYVNDVLMIFGGDMKYLHYQREDLSLVHEYLLTMSKYTDRQIFSTLKFEDDLGIGKTIKLLDFWNWQTNNVNYDLGANKGTNLNWIHPLWKRAICMYFIDRDLLKKKVNSKLANKPFTLNILKKTYKSFRWIYRKLK